MIAKPTLILICFLVPFLGAADSLDVYRLLTGKTVLMPSALPALPDSISSDAPIDKTNAVARIERALADKGVEIVQDGPHFVRLISRATWSFLTNAPLRGGELALARSQEVRTNGQEATPTGCIDFSGAELNQVLSIYALLSQRTILRAAHVPGPVIRLRTQGSLTLEEAVYAMKTVLALNGFCVVDDGPKFVQVAAMAERAQLKTRAPKPEPGAMLFDPNKVPSIAASGSMGTAIPPRPPTDVERVKQEFERLTKAFYDFMHIHEPNKQSPQRLLELYARLADKTAVASTNFDRVPILFHVETPLTRSELLYAIETTFTLNNLAIVPADNQRIRLGHILERSKGARAQDANLHPKR